MLATQVSARDRRATDVLPEEEVSFKLEAAVSGKKIVAGEVFNYTLTLISNTPDIEGVYMVSEPSAPEGLTLAGEPRQRQYEIRRLRDGRYAVDVLTKSYIAGKSGSYVIPGSTLEVQFVVREVYSDSFFGPVSRGRRYSATVSCGNTKVKVRDLPKCNHQDFSGAVGQYSFKCDYSDLHYDKGAEFTLTFTLQGRGYLGNVGIPDFRSIFGEGLKLKSVIPQESYFYSDGVFYSRIVYECSLTTTEYGSFVIPPLGFTYFDTSTMKYTTTSTSPCNLEVVSPRSRDKTPGQYVYESPAPGFLPKLDMPLTLAADS